MSDIDTISDVSPGFETDKLESSSYDKKNYSALFVDMRHSTLCAQKSNITPYNNKM